MQNISIILYSALIIIAAAIANIAVWSRSKTSVRVLAVVLTALFVPLTYVGLNEILSRPKPVDNEWFKRHVDEAVLLGAEYVEGKAIYLWLRLEDSDAPAYYMLPWQPQLAERLENLIDEGMRSDKEVKIKNPFVKRSYDDLGEMNMEIIEPPTLPLKLPPTPVDVFDPRKDSI